MRKLAHLFGLDSLVYLPRGELSNSAVRLSSSLMSHSEFLDSRRRLAEKGRGIFNRNFGSSVALRI